MEVLSRAVYRGPNVHARVPVATITVACGRNVDRRVATLPRAFLLRLTDTSAEAAAAARHMRTDAAATVPGLLAAIARAVQVAADAHVRVAATRPTRAADVRLVLVGYEDPEVGAAALELAVVLVNDAMLAADGPAGGARRLDTAAARRQFAAVVGRYQLMHATRALLREAERRDIPWRRITASVPFVQLGHGRMRQRISSTLTGRMGRIAQRLATDKGVANELMRAAGIPVPEQRPVATSDAAVRAAAELGYPVVVKAGRIDEGKAVHVDLTDAAMVRRAFAAVAAHGHVLVERRIPGIDYRLLVVDGKLVAAARRIPARVVGDGRSSIRSLVDRANRDPRRGDVARSSYLVTLTIDEPAREMLREQGLEPEDVPQEGRIVTLCRIGSLILGGTAEDVTGIVHPDYRRAAERATRLIGLDIAGIDFVTSDITRPIAETGAAVCEINSSPALRPHLVADGADAPALCIESLFPSAGNGRIPLAAVTGGGDDRAIAVRVAQMMRASGSLVGLATSQGASVDGIPALGGDLANVRGARLVLDDPGVDVAILETSVGDIVRHGLGFDRCNVAAVLDGGPAAVVAAVTDDLVVLDADHPASQAIRRVTPARAACWVSPDPASRLAGAERPPEDIAVTLAGTGGAARIVVRSGVLEQPVATLPPGDPRPSLFAVAVAWGLGAPISAMAAGLAEPTGAGSVPSRR